MKHILKNQEPKSLTQHRSQTNANYDNCLTATKEDIRRSLLDEQGDICCYCLQRIKPKNAERLGDDMKIEHFKPQNIYNGTNGYPDLTLDYQNMLGACPGVQKNDTHCDTHKGGQEITINPLDPNCEGLIKYRKTNGEVYSDDEVINRDLNEVLNLNLQTLKVYRQQALEALVNVINKETNGEWTKAFIQRKIKKYKERNDRNQYAPFCQMIVFYLEKKLKRLS